VRGCAWLCDGANAAAWQGEVEGWGGGAEILCKKRGDAASATCDEKIEWTGGRPEMGRWETFWGTKISPVCSYKMEILWGYQKVRERLGDLLEADFSYFSLILS
jgi:hypothetical protein